MNIQVQWPLMRDDDGDLNFYTSIEELLADTEVVDVRSGVYEVFDVAGRRFLLVATQKGGIFASDVLSLEPDHSTDVDPKEVRNRIERFLGRLGYNHDELAEIAIDKLVGYCRRGARRY